MARPKTAFGKTNWKNFYYPVKGRDAYASHITLIQWGPQYLGLRDTPEIEYGPGPFTRAHPELFGGGTVSAPEGWFFWGLLQIRGPMGPEGGWQYQKAVRPGGAKIGSANVDFVIASRPKDIAVRVQGEYFHLEGGPEKESSDTDQIYMLEDAGYDVVDVFPSMFMSDPSGIAVKRVAQMAIDRDPSLIPGSSTYRGV